MTDLSQARWRSRLVRHSGRICASDFGGGSVQDQGIGEAEDYWNGEEGSGYYGKLSDGHLPSAAAAYKERMKIFYDDQRSTRDFCR